MTRRTRIAVTVGALVAVQAIAVLAYRAVERSRTTQAAATFVAQRLTDSELAPVIAGKRADGSAVALAWPAPRPRLVHFWATWCGPCREELPGLLALARDMRDREFDVVAIAVDDTWPDISAFFGGTVPAEVIVENDGAAHKRFGVSTLPDSYLVDRSGQLVERYEGPRDWRARTAREHLLATIKDARP